MKEMKFYRCSRCGNLVEMIEDSGVKPVCCAQTMTLLEPNTVEASGEKHMPAVTVKEGSVEVNVGTVDHPMTDAHYIQWVAVMTEKGMQRRTLNPADAPHVVFTLGEEKPLAVYAYCNLHGLWMQRMD